MNLLYRFLKFNLAFLLVFLLALCLGGALSLAFILASSPFIVPILIGIYVNPISGILAYLIISIHIFSGIREDSEVENYREVD